MSTQSFEHREVLEFDTEWPFDLQSNIKLPIALPIVLPWETLDTMDTMDMDFVKSLSPDDFSCSPCPRIFYNTPVAQSPDVAWFHPLMPFDAHVEGVHDRCEGIVEDDPQLQGTFGTLNALGTVNPKDVCPESYDDDGLGQVSNKPYGTFQLLQQFPNPNPGAKILSSITVSKSASVGLLDSAPIAPTKLASAMASTPVPAPAIKIQIPRIPEEGTLGGDLNILPCHNSQVKSFTSASSSSNPKYSLKRKHIDGSVPSSDVRLSNPYPTPPSSIYLSTKTHKINNNTWTSPKCHLSSSSVPTLHDLFPNFNSGTKSLSSHSHTGSSSTPNKRRRIRYEGRTSSKHISQHPYAYSNPGPSSSPSSTSLSTLNINPYPSSNASNTSYIPLHKLGKMKNTIGLMEFTIDYSYTNNTLEDEARFLRQYHCKKAKARNVKVTRQERQGIVQNELKTESKTSRETTGNEKNQIERAERVQMLGLQRGIQRRLSLTSNI
ncbi:hypothetical protein J3R30DRAFT_3715114 [Lentinula aciculospora]|uniref:Uncharacterized protein n=1 Tax=Lentinula aciculospora TaxID=153920 RepID=A0A9W9DGD2_9AGAR|nr:hypothetical protein J3R30DRAFT_3715114 [Lentinula aciculospora]